VKIVFAGHKTGVNCIAFSHDGLILATGGKVYFNRVTLLIVELVVGFCYCYLGYCK
jgi:WD40 repeat protein